MKETKNERLLHKFRVEPIEGFQPGAKCYLDDKHIYVKGYTLEHHAGGLAHLTLEIDVRADAEYDNLELQIEQPSEVEYRGGLRETRKILCDLYRILEDIAENGEEKDLQGLRKLYKYFETHSLAEDTVRIWGDKFKGIKQDIKNIEIPLALIGQFQYICKIYADVKEDVEMSLIRNHEGKYFIAKTTIRPHDGGVNVLPVTIDEIDDFTMEFYPEEYARIKPILDAEREKSAKNKKE